MTHTRTSIVLCLLCSAAAAMPQQRPAARSFRLSPGELAIWNDPRFKQRFADSYLAETATEPSVTADERKTMLQVLELISSDKMGEAAAIVERQRSDAATAVFDFTLGNIHYQQEQYPLAAAAYEIAVRKYPKFRRAWINLGQIRFRLNEFEDAVTAFTHVIELGGGDAVTYGLLGAAHAHTGKYIAAESAFRMATLLDPKTVDWQMGLAESFFKQSRFADAASLFGNLIESQPDRADLWLAQGECYARLEQPLRAAENFEMVDRLGGSTVASLENLGDIYATRELFDLAVDAYVRAMRRNPDGDVARALRAARFISGNGAVQPVRTLVDAIESIHGDKLAEGDRKDVLRMRARIALAEGAGEEEARILEQIVALDPLDGDALILLGQHSRRNGDDAKATSYFERAAEIEGFEADAKLNLGSLLVRRGDYRAALPHLRRAQALKPRDAVARFVDDVERAARSR